MIPKSYDVLIPRAIPITSTAMISVLTKLHTHFLKCLFVIVITSFNLHIYFITKEIVMQPSPQLIYSTHQQTLLPRYSTP